MPHSNHRLGHIACLDTEFMFLWKTDKHCLCMKYTKALRSHICARDMRGGMRGDILPR